MTLCIAWRYNNKIQFSSDSRITADNEGQYYVDIAIKVMAIKVKIFNPIPAETGRPSIIYNHIIGMCFSGNTTTTFLLKEAVSEILTKLQVYPGYTDFSFQGICNVIKDMLTHTANKIREGFDYDQDVQFLLGGFCPQKEKVLVYRFDLIDMDEHYDVDVEEVLQDEENDLEIIGSGSDEAWTRLNNDESIYTDTSIFDVIKAISLDNDFPEVGGPIQYGYFNGDDFVITGVADFTIDENGILQNKFPLRGTYLYDDSPETTAHGFHVMATFIQPFQQDMLDHLNGI